MRALRALLLVLFLSTAAQADFEGSADGDSSWREAQYPTSQDFIDAYDEAYAYFVIDEAYYEAQGWTVGAFGRPRPGGVILLLDPDDPLRARPRDQQLVQPGQVRLQRLLRQQHRLDPVR